MVKREKVADARGRRWVSGTLDADVYFGEVRRQARAQARQAVQTRLAQAAAAPVKHLFAR